MLTPPGDLIQPQSQAVLAALRILAHIAAICQGGQQPMGGAGVERGGRRHLRQGKASYVAFIGTLFIRLLKMCVYPLVLFSIIAGIANVADIEVDPIFKTGCQAALHLSFSKFHAIFF